MEHRSVTRLAALAGSLAFGAACHGSDLPVYWDAPEFALVDQTGDSLRRSDLLGRPWVASFIFTNCTDVCPLISARMALLRDRLDRELPGHDVRLVSFSVDPARDTPEVLGRYAEGFGGSPPGEWAFLTGTPPGAIQDLIQEGFRLTAGAAPADSSDYQIVHSPRLLLVDARGRVRATYDSREADVVDRILADLRRLR